MPTRRRFLATAALAGAAGLLGRPAEAEPPPETTRIRLMRTTSLCWAPQLIADELLRAEGFTDVSYLEVPVGRAVSELLVKGEADLGMNFVGPNIVRIDR